MTGLLLWGVVTLLLALLAGVALHRSLARPREVTVELELHGPRRWTPARAARAYGVPLHLVSATAVRAAADFEEQMARIAAELELPMDPWQEEFVRRYMTPSLATQQPPRHWVVTSTPRSRGASLAHTIMDEAQRFAATGELDDPPFERAHLMSWSSDPMIPGAEWDRARRPVDHYLPPVLSCPEAGCGMAGRYDALVDHLDDEHPDRWVEAPQLGSPRGMHWVPGVGQLDPALWSKANPPLTDTPEP